MIRLGTYVAVAAISLLLAIVTRLGTAPSNVALGLFLGFAVPIVDLAASSGRRLRLAWYTGRYWNSTVRITASYLYRIRIDGDYLLVKSARWPHFQPVGGVYKYSPGALARFRALDDSLLPVDSASAGDLRIRIRGKHLYGLVRWFESGLEREYSPWREFQEELVAGLTLPAEQFPYIYDKFIARTIRPMRYSRRAQSNELQVFDVFEMVPSSQQETTMRHLRANRPAGIHFASEDEIRRLGVKPGKDQELAIAETAVWMVEA